jgi:hypothetical protein
MKTVEITKQARAVNALVDKARLDDVLLRTADGAEFFLTAVDDFDEEIARTSQNKKLMAYLQQRAKAPVTMTLEQVKQRFGLIGAQKRPSRKRRHE